MKYMDPENQEHEKNDLENLNQQFIVDSFVYNTKKTTEYVKQILYQIEKLCHNIKDIEQLYKL